MTDTFSEGDLIEATKGDTVIRGRVDNITGQILGLSEAGWPLDSLADGGYTLTLIEKAAPALPTEPGWYVDYQNDVWRLNASGVWYCPASPHDNAKEYAPFARLEPVADTAKKVLNRLAELDAAVTGDTCGFTKRHIARLSEEFGVTS